MATAAQATAAASKVRRFLESREGLVGVGVGEKPNGYVVRVYGTNDLHTADLPAGVDNVPVLVHRTDPPEAYGAAPRSDDGSLLALGAVAALVAAGAAVRSISGSRAHRRDAASGVPKRPARRFLSQCKPNCRACAGTGGDHEREGDDEEPDAETLAFRRDGPDWRPEWW